MNKKFLLFAPVALAILVGAVSRVAPPPRAPEGRLYVATIPPLAFILHELAAGRAEVKSLLPPGASPHNFEPRPALVGWSESALALFAVSPAFDPWAGRLPAARRVFAFDLLPESLRLSGHEHGAHRPGEDEALKFEASAGEFAARDPHFWTDPLAVRAIVRPLAGALCDLDSEGCEQYRANADRFETQLAALDRDVRETLDGIGGQPVVLMHPSFAYFLRRYDLKLAGIVEPFPGKEPTPRLLEQLIGAMRSTGVRAVFTEPQLSKSAARVLAESAGVPVYQLDPLGGFPGRKTYGDLIRYNASIFAQALR